MEFHRGTYTTQSNNKKGNREAETLMRNLETLATYASIWTDFKYPKQAIDDMWEDICLMQFHDCLPGSCIEMVYRDTDRLYKALFEKGAEIIEEASAALGIFSKPSERTSSVPHFVNYNHWPRTEILKVPKSSIGPGVQLNTQAIDDNETYVAASSFRGYDLTQGVALRQPPQAGIRELTGSVFILENDNIKVTVKGGAITSLIFLQHNREVIPQGKKANQLVIYDDKPLYWQAWDVELYHFE